jgi:DNA-binding NtrC family response regulator
MSTLRILIVDDEAPSRVALSRALRRPGYEIVEAEHGAAALEMLQSQSIDLMFLDLNMPVLTGTEVLRQWSSLRQNSHSPTVEVIVLTANDRVQAAVECMQLGADDYLAKPYEIEQVRTIAARTARRRALEAKVDDLQSQLRRDMSCGDILGMSPAMRRLFQQIERAATVEIDVLIRGETGTGKELIAREIHRRSSRASGPFVAVNTAAVAESLAESELFGHVRGSFTGAAADRAGVFEQADGGTLFLDEIGDMPINTQAKILRTLQERAVQRVGSSDSRRVDVRIITATHQDLEQAIDAGRFRRDLYFRIRGLELQVPPLRTRHEDILLLARHFAERYRRPGVEPPSFHATAVERMLSHNWPGNVRELEQTVRAAAALSSGSEIMPIDLGLQGTSGAEGAAATTFDAFLDLPLTEAKERLIEQFERLAIERALQRNAGNVSAASRELGIHRQNLQQKITALGIVVEKPT